MTSDVNLTSNLTESMRAYDTQTIIFRCATRGTGTTLFWGSDAYIGSRYLRFTYHNRPGRHRVSSTNNNTVATLINITTDANTGITGFISELKIIASQQYPTSSVRCRLNDDGSSNNTLVFCKADQYC